ncbi:MAG: hypothetical protein ABEH43_08705, partial [Flavobacteriales bacterium]
NTMPQGPNLDKNDWEPIFDTFWGENLLKKIEKLEDMEIDESEAGGVERSQEEFLKEILEIVRNLQRNDSSFSPKTASVEVEKSSSPSDIEYLLNSMEELLPKVLEEKYNQTVEVDLLYPFRRNYIDVYIKPSQMENFHFDISKSDVEKYNDEELLDHLYKKACSIINAN